MVTYLKAIVSVLEGAGKPLNYREIARRALERGLIPKTKSMTSNVSKIITTHLDPPNQVFVKVERGIYGLKKDNLPQPRIPKPKKPERRAVLDSPIMEYREYLYKTNHGTLVKGQINKGTKFMFCEKNKDLFISGLKGEKEITSALYALFNTETDSVYIGITRRGYRRITDHWKGKFTHIAILFSEEKWSTDLRTNLERDLTESFKLLPWKPTNQVEDSELDESDKRTRMELLPLLGQIATRTHTLTHNMNLLYPDHIVDNSRKNEKKPRPGKDSRSKSKRRVSTDPSVTHCWIWSCPKSIYEIVQSRKIWASKSALEDISVRVHPGNLVTFYVKEHKAFSGVYEFVDEWYRAPHAMWPDEIKSGRIIHTSQIRLRRIKDGHAALDALKPRLKIFRDNASGNAGIVLQSGSGYPGNHGRPIPDSDMKIILDSMRPMGTGQG